MRYSNTDSVKIGIVIFNGKANDNNTYQLFVTNNVVFVLRNFKGDTENQDGVPSGWALGQVIDSPTLTIDGGQDWVVYPTQAAWDEIKELAKI